MLFSNPNPSFFFPLHQCTIDIDSLTQNSSMEETTSKFSRRQNLCKAAAAKIEDRISKLPDEVLCHILSFIPTKHAVGTSVLSKRWKHIWKSVPNLDFNETLRFDGYPDRPVSNTTSFTNFVDRVLNVNRSLRVKNFCIICIGDYNDRLDAWISAAVSRDIECLDLSFSDERLALNLEQGLRRAITLPSSLLNRENLVDLRLQNITLNFPKSVYFPGVETVYLSSVQFLDDESLRNLISGCPVLNELIIERESWDNAESLYIRSSTLDNLLLHTDPCDHKMFGYKVVIDAPSLRYLSITDYADDDYDLKNLSSLESAYLDIERNCTISPNFDVFSARLFKLLKKISHVEDLCLASGTSTMRSLEFTYLINLPIFNNLTSLKLEVVHPSWRILPHVFEYSPNLVTFAFKKVYCHHELEVYQKCEFHEPFQTKCMLLSLENINITGFENCGAEMKMLRFFLENAMVLKTMSIQSYNLGLETQNKVHKKLLMCPKSSRRCQVEFSNSTDSL